MRIGKERATAVAVLHDEAPVARLVASAATTPEAWNALALGRVSVSVRAHAEALTDGLADEARARIGGAVARGRALLAVLEGPVPAAWVGRMRELHRDALLGLWEADGHESRERVFQVLGAIPTRWGRWLDEGVARVDGADVRGAGLAVVDAAVGAWLGDAVEGR